MEITPQSTPQQVSRSQLGQAGVGIVALLVVVGAGLSSVMSPASEQANQHAAAPATVATQSMQGVIPDNLPMPFGPAGGASASNIKGELVQLGVKNNIPVWKVYFDQATSETLTPDKIYVAVIPNGTRVVPMDLALAIGGGGATDHDVDLYGYLYTPNAATEIANRNAELFIERFPNKFLATQTAWDQDPLHGNALANFEATHAVDFKPTDGSAGAVPLQPGLYVFIANQTPSTVLKINAPDVCGDTLKSGSEECDDGNTVTGDGCSATCLAEICGNSRVDSGEQCDDGNTQSGDGCSATCQSEGICGNSVTEPPEQCDDGKHCSDLVSPCTTDSDCAAIPGEDNTCAPRDNFGCSATCTSQPWCGNEIVEPPEECDDGNLVSGDGCENDCTFTPGPFF